MMNDSNDRNNNKEDENDQIITHDKVCSLDNLPRCFTNQIFSLTRTMLLGIYVSLTLIFLPMFHTLPWMIHWILTTTRRMRVAKSSLTMRYIFLITYQGILLIRYSA